MVQIGPKQQTPRATAMVDAVISRQHMGFIQRSYLSSPRLTKLIGSLTGGAGMAIADRAASNWAYTSYTLFFTVLAGLGLGWLVTALLGNKAELQTKTERIGRLEQATSTLDSQIPVLKKQIEQKDQAILALRQAIGGVYEGAEIENGEFKVEKKLGEGSFGIVWKVLDTNLEKHFVLKHADPNSPFSSQALDGFAREAKLLARLEHPNIVRVIRFFQNLFGSPAFVMEYVEGTEVADMVRTPGSLPPLQAMNMMCQLLDGLEYAHKNGVVHRDLKPENLMWIPGEGIKGTLKILDFGIAKKAEGMRTAAGPRKTAGAVGTPFYMAYEQYGLGETASSWKTDLWAWGVILWEMLSGTVPFPGSNPTEVMGSVFQKSLPGIKLPASLENRLTDKQRNYIMSVFHWMIGKEPGNRLPEQRMALAGYEARDLQSDEYRAAVYGKLREITGALKTMFEKIEHDKLDRMSTDRLAEQDPGQRGRRR